MRLFYVNLNYVTHHIFLYPLIIVIMFIKNQNIEIKKTSSSYKIIVKQSVSTPGIYKKYYVTPFNNYVIQVKKLTMLKSTNLNLIIWIADKSTKTISTIPITQTDTSKIIKLKNKNNNIIHIGILFRTPKINDYFFIEDLKLIELSYSLINPISTSILASNQPRYLYIIHYTDSDRMRFLYLINQLYFREWFVKYGVDIIDFYSITTSLLKRYDVVLLDYLALYTFNKNKELYRKKLNVLNAAKNVCMLMQDMHKYTFISERFDKSKFRYNTNGYIILNHFLKNHNISHLIFRCYCNEMIDMLKICTNVKSHLLIENCAHPFIFRDYGLPKKYDILIYGETKKDAYPFRYRLKWLLAKYSHIFNVYIVPNVERKFDSKNNYDRFYCDDKLSRLINQSWITIATNSRYSYLVKKYFEISSSKSVIAGDMNMQGKNIWKNNFIELNNNMSDGEIIIKLHNALKNKKQLEQMADNMYDKIRSKHSYESNANKIYKYMQGICNDNVYNTDSELSESDFELDDYDKIEFDKFDNLKVNISDNVIGRVMVGGPKSV